MQRLIVIVLLSLLILSCSRKPRIGVVNPEDVAGLKTTRWTFIQANTTNDIDLDDESNWVPMQPYISSDDVDMPMESEWEEVK